MIECCEEYHEGGEDISNIYKDILRKVHQSAVCDQVLKPENTFEYLILFEVLYKVKNKNILSFNFYFESLTSFPLLSSIQNDIFPCY